MMVWAGLVHSYMHRYEYLLNFPYKMTAVDFIRCNQKAVKKIYAHIQMDLHVKRTPALDECLKLGVESYLKHEGILHVPEPPKIDLTGYKKQRGGRREYDTFPLLGVKVAAVQGKRIQAIVPEPEKVEEEDVLKYTLFAKMG